MKCSNIQEVINQLTIIVEDCKHQQNPMGYFAVLYRKVTIRVQQGIQLKEFEDNVRMEQLDVLFANRYFEAYDAYRNQLPCSQSWQTAFEACKQSGKIILQHLLLGINAHINLDLGIAAAETMHGKSIEGIHHDFNAINRLLSEMTDDVKHTIGKISPVFKWLLPLANKLDEALMNFSIEIARDKAWEFACRIAGNKNSTAEIMQRDSQIAFLGTQLRNPGLRLRFLNKMIALSEWRSVKSNLEIIERG